MIFARSKNCWPKGRQNHDGVHTCARPSRASKSEPGGLLSWVLPRSMMINMGRSNKARVFQKRFTLTIVATKMRGG